MWFQFCKIVKFLSTKSATEALFCLLFQLQTCGTAMGGLKLRWSILLFGVALISRGSLAEDIDDSEVSMS